jgi:hypothetical protein
MLGGIRWRPANTGAGMIEIGKPVIECATAGRVQETVLWE